jgi:lipopolysaccharide transport system ATP-binding protein
MYVRLAFAVAAHLEPEILVVDEVLAVGDAVFQKKCLAKMTSVAASGRTILFVSHNTGAVRSLCRNAVWLEAGTVKMIGDAEKVTAQYVSGDPSDGETASGSHRGSGEIHIDRTRTTSIDGELQTAFLVEEPIRLSLEFSVFTPVRATFWFVVTTAEGIVILSSFQKDTDSPLLHRENGVASVVLDSPTLLPGVYILTVGAFAADGSTVDWVDAAAQFEVLRHFADGRSFDFRHGIVTQRLPWAFEKKCANDRVCI